MLKSYLEQRHIDLDSGRSCLALEREYWQALEVLAYEDGWNNWRDFFYMRVLPERPDDIPLASFVRQSITKYLFEEYDRTRPTPKKTASPNTDTRLQQDEAGSQLGDDSLTLWTSSQI